MKAPFSGIPGTDWRLDDKEYQFSGTPNACIGQLSFINDSEKKVKVRSLQVESLKRVDVDGSPGANPSSTLSSSGDMDLHIRVPAKSKQNAEASLQLDPSTAPGTYVTNIRYGELSQK